MLRHAGRHPDNEASVKLQLPFLLAVAAFFLYASQSFLLERKLASYSVPAVLIQLYAFNFVVVAVLLLGTKISGKPIAWPTGAALGWVAVASVVFFLADAFYVSAFAEAQKRGEEHLFAIVAASALLPVFASAVKYAWTRQLPNGWHIASYVTVAVVLVFTALGNRLELRRQAAAKSAPPAIIETRP